MMEQQHHLHVGIQENSFEARMNAWEYFLPFYFVMNKLNYARYGSYDLHHMKNKEVIHPRLKVPVSVQEQNWYIIRTPTDQRREPTLNKQAKTVGGIKGTAANTNAVAKWTLNRSYQAENLSCLHKMCNLTTTSNIYKQNRPSYILRSKNIVFKVINTFKNHINPFEKETLFNLDSGAAMPTEVTEYLLLLHEKGKDLCNDFLQSRILTATKSFHNKITRNNNIAFDKKN